PLLVVGLRVKPIYRPTGELQPGCSSVQGLAVIQRHFTAGEIGPITVLLSSDHDWSSPEGRAVIDHLSRGFAYLDNVAEVRSLTQPLGKPLPTPMLTATSSGLFGQFMHRLANPLQKLVAQGDRSARAFYLATVPGDSASPGPRYVTRFDVVLRSDPFGSASMVTLGQLQYWLRERLSATTFGHLEGECYGITVNAHDLAAVTDADRVRVNALVLGGIFVILLLVVRRPWLAGYLLVTVLFSYLATLGATTLISSLWSGRPLGQVDWRVPFFLFTILVAVGEDYNIFVITRMLQERRQFGAVEGIRRAIAHTGSTITCCGLIMAGTFATLMLAGLSTLVQIGFALAFGVLLDTFIIRPLLVPALTLCVWRWQGEDPGARTTGPGNRQRKTFAA
ncbi:MAG TPA: MMPL family transporter, partial [Gemmataceae bacterium]|nr:MMPL family transporter [Gemmataceae bacterium]